MTLPTQCGYRPELAFHFRFSMLSGFLNTFLWCWAGQTFIAQDCPWVFHYEVGSGRKARPRSASKKRRSTLHHVVLEVASLVTAPLE